MSFEWVAILYAIGLALVFSELFMPGLIIGTVGVIAMGTSIYFMYAGHGALAGTLQLGASIVVLTLVASYAVRRLTQRGVQEGYSSSDETLAELVGREGVAASALRPSGIVKIEGRRVDVVSRGEMIAQGAKVRVIEVEGNRVVVREVAGAA